MYTSINKQTITNLINAKSQSKQCLHIQGWCLLLHRGSFPDKYLDNAPKSLLPSAKYAEDEKTLKLAKKCV